MNKSIKWMMMMSSVLLLTSACQIFEKPESNVENEGRTYFETLDLETPEEAVQTFTEAFQRQDFMTVYLVLDAGTQRQLRIENARTFQWKHLIGERASQDLFDDLDLKVLIEIQFDFWYVFDQIMLHAARQDDLIIDLKGDLDILRNEESKIPDGRQATDVITKMEGVSGEVIFYVVKDSDNHWRIYSVSAPEEGVDAWPSTMLE